MILKILRNSLLFFLFINYNSYAGLQIGVLASYLDIKDDYYSGKDDIRPSISYGYSYFYKPLVINISTNRLVNQPNIQNGQKDGLFFESKTKITTDNLSLGYKINRFIPYVFLTNARVEKSLYYNKFLGKTDQYSLLYGIGTTFIYNKDFNFNASLIAPNKEQKLDYGVSFLINYALD